MRRAANPDIRITELKILQKEEIMELTFHKKTETKSIKARLYLSSRVAVFRYICIGKRMESCKFCIIGLIHISVITQSIFFFHLITNLCLPDILLRGLFVLEHGLQAVFVP